MSRVKNKKNIGLKQRKKLIEKSASLNIDKIKEIKDKTNTSFEKSSKSIKETLSGVKVNPKEFINRKKEETVVSEGNIKENEVASYNEYVEAEYVNINTSEKVGMPNIDATNYEQLNNGNTNELLEEHHPQVHGKIKCKSENLLSDLKNDEYTRKFYNSYKPILEPYNEFEQLELISLLEKRGEELAKVIQKYDLTYKEIICVSEYFEDFLNHPELLRVIKVKSIGEMDKLIRLASYGVLEEELLNEKIPEFYLQNLIYSAESLNRLKKISMLEQVVLSMRNGLENPLNSIIDELNILKQDVASLEKREITEVKYTGYNLKDKEIINKIKKYEKTLVTLKNNTVKEQTRYQNTYDKIEKNYNLLMDNIAIYIDKNSDIKLRLEIWENEYKSRKCTLAEVGNIFDITRERVRQVESKCYKKLDLEFDFSERKLGLNEMILKKNGFKVDENFEYGIPEVYGSKYLQNKYKLLQSKCVYLGKYLERNTHELFRCFWHQKQYRVGAELIEIYDSFVESLPDDLLYLMPLDQRVIEGFLNRDGKCIKTSGFSYRYWSGNLDLLIYKLKRGFDQYPDFFSTSKIFDEHNELMQIFDIRDEYELHYILKNELNGISGLTFLKSPHVSKGGRDIIEWIKTSILSSNKDVESSLEEIVRETGIKEMTIRGSYLPKIQTEISDAYQREFSTDFKIKAKSILCDLEEKAYLLDILRTENDFIDKYYDDFVYYVSTVSDKFTINFTWMLPIKDKSLLSYIQNSASKEQIFEECLDKDILQSRKYKVVKRNGIINRVFYQYTENTLYVLDEEEIKNLEQFDKYFQNDLVNNLELPMNTTDMLEDPLFEYGIHKFNLGKFEGNTLFWQSYLLNSPFVSFNSLKSKVYVSRAFIDHQTELAKFNNYVDEKIYGRYLFNKYNITALDAGIISAIEDAGYKFEHGMIKLCNSLDELI